MKYVYDHTRTHSTGFGGAQFSAFAPEPEPWIIEATNALDLREAWLAENEKGRKLYAAVKAASDEVMAARKRQALTAELEPLEAASQAATLAVKRQAQVSLRALRKYDQHVLEARMSGALKDVAVDATLKAQARAEAALADLKAALADRDSAYKVAGQPALAFHYSKRSLAHNTLGTVHAAEETLQKVVEHFPTASQIERSFADAGAEEAASE